MNAGPLGLIGLGLLGSALAERLLAAGYSLVGYDLRPENRQSLEKAGGTAVDSAQAVFARCRRVLLSLPDSGVVTAVMAEGKDAASAGTVVVDTTTGAPEAAVALAEELSRRGITYLDATVLGSSEQARKRDVVVMVGGPAEAYVGVADILTTFARESWLVGPVGSGSRMKLVVNLVLGLNRAVLAEGLSLARSAGLDPTVSLEILRAGAAYSRVMDTKGPKMLSRDFAPVARLAQHLKDVRLILEEANRCDAPVPLSELHARLLQSVVDSGAGDEDNSAILRAFDLLRHRSPAVPPPTPPAHPAPGAS